MSRPSRRTVIRGSLCLGAAGTVARPFIAKAAATTASVWWTQGFVREEDAAFQAMVADYEKQSGNTIDASIIPFAPLMQKIVSSLTSGDVPDVMEHNTADATVIPQYAWNFKPVQAKLRGQGMRGVYSLGLQCTTAGPADGNNLFSYFLAAYGGYNIITPDGRPHLDDPTVREAVIKTISYITTAFKQGYVPPGALDWSDADDNNAFHAKQIVMDLDGTISTELAMYHDKEKYDDVVTLGLPNNNEGKPIPSPLGVSGAFIPKGAKNIAVAKEFVQYVIQPKVAGAYLKAGLARWLPAIPDVVKNDPWWTDPKDPHRLAYVQQGVLGETVPYHYAFNPGWSEANAAQVWGSAHASVIRDNVSPEAAADAALKRIGDILAKYPIAQS